VMGHCGRAGGGDAGSAGGGGRGGLGELGFRIVTGQHLAPTIEGFRGEVVGGRGTRGRGGANGRRMRR
jgi:hypothetical protein